MSLKTTIRDIGLNAYLKRKSFIPDPGLPNVKGVAILFSAESLAHQQLASSFSESVQKIIQEPSYLVGYVHRQLVDDVTFGFTHFSLSDVALVPDFKSHKLDIFFQKNYQVLINLDLVNYPILHYVAARVQAKNKLAINPRYHALYNIIVKRDGTDTMESLVSKTLDIFEKTLGR